MLRLVLATAAIACGLVVTLAPLGLPYTLQHDLGSMLWGAMVLLIVAALRGDARFSATTLLLAAAGAAAVECFKLYHAPTLDAFRLTLPGALLLGRVFNLWNIAAYWLGILAAAPLYGATCGRVTPPPAP